MTTRRRPVGSATQRYGRGRHAPAPMAAWGQQAEMLMQGQLMGVAGPRGDLAAGQPLMRLTYNPTATPMFYNCCPPLFDLCTDEDIGVLFYEDSEPFLNWLRVREASACRIEQVYLQYMAMSGASTGTLASALPTNICEPGNFAEWGTVDYVLEGFGTLTLSAPVRKNGGADLPYCERAPRYTIDGLLIESQDDWDMHLLVNVLMQQMAIRLLIGNAATSFDHNGLQQIIKTGYTTQAGDDAPLLDSTVINWASQYMCSPEGAAGVTVNGTALPAGQSLYKVLRDVFYRLRYRLRLAKLPMPQPGDIAIVMPEHAISCLIDCAVCWVECGGDFLRMDSEAAVAARQDLMAGGIGFGIIRFDGFEVPIIPFNPWDYANDRGYMDNADGSVDLYMLYRGPANRPVLTLEYNDLSDGTLDTTDEGQFQVWQEEDARCIQTSMATEWRIFLNAPWAQTVINNVACETTFGTFGPGIADPVLANRTLYPVAANCV